MFVPDPFRLMVNLDGLGSGRVISTPAGVDCDEPCSGLFPPGTMVSLSPVAADGSVFVGFTGDCTGTECELAMDRAHGVVANFALGYPLNVTFEGLGPPGEEGTGSAVARYPRRRHRPMHHGDLEPARHHAPGEGHPRRDFSVGGNGGADGYGGAFCGLDRCV